MEERCDNKVIHSGHDDPRVKTEIDENEEGTKVKTSIKTTKIRLWYQCQ